MIDPNVKNYVDGAIKSAQKNARYDTTNASYHTHNGIDSPKLNIGSSSSVAARAYGTSSASIPTGADTKVLLNSLDFAAGITWDATNSRFVVLTAGYYTITGIATYSSTTSGKLYQTEISLNGNAITPGASAKCYFQASITSGAAGPCATTVLSLSVGDYIELYTWHNVGSNASIYNASGLTYLAISKA